MTTSQILKEYIKNNGISISFIARKSGMSRELLRRSLEGSRNLKADEFVKICKTLSLEDLNYFTAKL
ncbi:helix-turn-helix domain-containing protein [Ethanoligenens harbinense]|uniref:helix-turn-helix domain-containing protein n=1 Tax=Ethanoligenens harbinense TaxID=253239 RepID=UPI003BF98C8C